MGLPARSIEKHKKKKWNLWEVGECFIILIPIYYGTSGKLHQTALFVSLLLFATFVDKAIRVSTCKKSMTHRVFTRHEVGDMAECRCTHTHIDRHAQIC